MNIYNILVRNVFKALKVLILYIETYIMNKPPAATQSPTQPQPVSSVKQAQTPSSQVTSPPSAAASTSNSFRLPGKETVEHAMKLAINEDRPIMMDYWKDSIEKTVLIGQRDDETKEKILVRSEEEYTSPIKQILKVGNDYIIMTENSIYLVDTGIPFRKISA
jgi:hypothetical protein